MQTEMTDILGSDEFLSQNLSSGNYNKIDLGSSLQMADIFGSDEFLAHTFSSGN